MWIIFFSRVWEHNILLDALILVCFEIFDEHIYISWAEYKMHIAQGSFPFDYISCFCIMNMKFYQI